MSKDPNGFDNDAFEFLNVDMAKQVIVSMMRRNMIVDEADCLAKLSSREWLNKEGYGHIAHILGGPAGREACRILFEKINSTVLAEVEQ
jgi:hypothetical protein